MIRASGHLLGLLVVSSVLSCSVPPHWTTETDYPATAIARVVKRSDIPSTPLVDPQENPPSIIIVPTRSGPILIATGSHGIARSASRIDYELRTKDGTLLVVQTSTEFPVGTCVALSGYADGPSRTHFSLGRAQLSPSDACE